MKKIIMVCSCLVLLLVLSVPAFAADDYIVKGKWMFNEVITKPFNVSIGETRTIDVNFISSGTSYYSMSESINATGAHHYLVYGRDGGNHSVYFWDKQGVVNRWQSSAYRTVDFGSNGQTVSADVYNWLISNAIPLICDGSSCPATDVNHDDICDDCGSPFTYNLRDDTTYLYNDVRLPIVPTPFGDKATYYTLYDDGTGTYTLVASDVRFWEDSGRIVVIEKGNLIYYAAASGDDEWSQFSTQTSGNWVHEVKSSDTVSWSSHIIHDFTTGATFMQGDVNFLPPLMEMAGQALSGEMVKIGKTLTILVACGVGCLACLVVLSLFGKRSLIFRS